MFSIIIWWLWRWRNERVFNNKEVELQRKLAWIKEGEEEIDRVFCETDACL